MTAAARELVRRECLPARGAEPDRGYNYQGARQLWRAVLAVNLDAALGVTVGVKCKSLDRYQAQQWIGSRGFRDVCELAGLDPEFVLERLRRSGH